MTGPLHGQVKAGTAFVRIALQGPDLVGIYAEGLCRLVLPLNHLFADLKIQPLLPAAVLPAGRTARSTVFDKIVAGIPLHVRHSPGHPVGPRHPKEGTTGQGGAHDVTVFPAQHGLVPDGRQTVDLQVWIGCQQSRSGCTSARRDGPGVAASQTRQVGNQLQGLVRQLVRNFDLPQQLEIDPVQSRREQFPQSLVVGDQLDQLQQQPLALLLPHRQAAEAEQVAEQQDGLLRPRFRLEPRGPHRQAAARVFHAVVDSLTVGGQIAKGSVIQLASFLLQPQIQAGLAKETVRLQELVRISNPGGRGPARDFTSEKDLRGAVDGVHVTQPVQAGSPRIALNMRHAVRVARDVKSATSVFGANGFHARLRCFYRRTDGAVKLAWARQASTSCSTRSIACKGNWPLASKLRVTWAPPANATWQ